MHPRLILLLVAGASCATVRPITYPSPCLDRGNPIRCQVTGYEVWGSPSQIQSQAKECPESAHVTIDPHRDYGVIRCYTPDDDANEAPAVVVVEQEPPTDLVVSLEEAEAPPVYKEPLIQLAPESALRDQPRPEKLKPKRKKKRAAVDRTYND